MHTTDECNDTDVSEHVYSRLSGLYSEMSKQVYWDEFYNLPKNSRPFDWLLQYSDVRDLLEAQLPSNGRFTLLDVGCGTSDFASNVARL